MKKSGHSVARNYSYNLIYQIISIIVPIITTPYVSRVLSPEGIGAYSYTQSICSYFTLFSIIGTDIYGQREIAYCREDRNKRSSVFWEIYIIRLIGIILCTALYIGLSLNTSGLNRNLLLIQLISVAGNIFNIVYLLQGVENFKSLLIRNIIVKIICVVCIFLLVKNEDDLWLYVVISTVAVVAGNITLWFNLRKYVDLKSLHHLDFKRHIAPSIALFIPTIALRLYDAFDKTMMGLLLETTTENGYYEQALKIITISITVVTSLGNVMLSRIASLFASNDRKKIQNYIIKSFDIVWLLSLPMSLGIIGISSNMVPWFFGMKYLKVADLLKWFAVICIPMGLKNVIGIQYLIPTLQQKKYTISIISGLLINIILNLCFIPKFEAIGAIIASILSELAIVGIQFFMIRKEMKILETFKCIPRKLVAAFIMLIYLTLVSQRLTSSIFHTVLLILTGGVLYFVVLVLLRDEMMQEIVGVVKTRIKIGE